MPSADFAKHLATDVAKNQLSLLSNSDIEALKQVMGVKRRLELDNLPDYGVKQAHDVLRQVAAAGGLSYRD